MNKTLLIAILSIAMLMSACSPLAAGTSTPASTAQPTAAIPPTRLPETQAPVPATPVQGSPTVAVKQYRNDAFGLSFQYPSDWYGPSEYVSGGTLRVEVGSDTVYPYGEPPETPSSVTNSYHIVLQYDKNNQNGFWKDTFQSLSNLKDGESVSGIRDMLIRVRQVDLGRFSGYEFISTLSETAQTEPVYVRSIILVDEKTGDVLNIMGTPNNVAVPSGSSWRDVYRGIDEANQATFEGVYSSITIQ